MEITLATMRDFDGVMGLLRANHVSNVPEEERINGFVTTNLTDGQMEALIAKERGVTIAREGDRVLAFALAAPWEYWSVWPLFQHMIKILPEYSFMGKPMSVEESYQYGPVCLERTVRGTGLFEEVFFASLFSMRERYPVMATFVNSINPRSYAAHSRKAGMDTLGTFDFNGNHYYLMACGTDAGQIKNNSKIRTDLFWEK